VVTFRQPSSWRDFVSFAADATVTHRPRGSAAGIAFHDIGKIGVHRIGQSSSGGPFARATTHLDPSGDELARLARLSTRRAEDLARRLFSRVILEWLVGLGAERAERGIRLELKETSTSFSPF
jgi:hypothetical protein